MRLSLLSVVIRVVFVFPVLGVGYLIPGFLETYGSLHWTLFLTVPYNCRCVLCIYLVYYVRFYLNKYNQYPVIPIGLRFSQNSIILHACFMYIINTTYIYISINTIELINPYCASCFLAAMPLSGKTVCSIC